VKRHFILIRREFWEHRMLWVTPLAVAAVVLLGVNALPAHLTVTRGGFDLSSDPNVAAEPDLSAAVLSQLWLFGLAAPFYIAAGIVGVSYLLDCLYGERRDRSILFWRSLPVSDTATVLTKLLVGLVLLPLVTYLLASVTSLAVAATAHLHSGGIPSPSWDASAWLHAQGLMLYTLVAAILWYAPYAAYLMLVSAWARRSVYAWAFVPPVVAAVLERALFGTAYVGHLVQRGFRELTGLAFGINHELGTLGGAGFGPPHGGGSGGAGGGGGGGRGWNPVADPSGLLHSPQLWLGLAAAGLMIWAAIQVRRRRDDA
jgi:ABC-2 type transport system permease protein